MFLARAAAAPAKRRHLPRHRAAPRRASAQRRRLRRSAWWRPHLFSGLRWRRSGKPSSCGRSRRHSGSICSPRYAFCMYKKGRLSQSSLPPQENYCLAEQPLQIYIWPYETPTPAEITIIGAVVFMYVVVLDIFLLAFLVTIHCHCTNLLICA